MCTEHISGFLISKKLPACRRAPLLDATHFNSSVLLLVFFASFERFLIPELLSRFYTQRL